MTFVIDCCFIQKIAQSQKIQEVNKFNFFLDGTSVQLKRKLTKLQQNSYCITFTSDNFQSKIKYFTLLDLFQNHVNIKIIPCDSNGCVIRSKQTFNKNGWIRKHINENKNKFLKVNPLTGQTFFKYSCFLPEKLKIGHFWNQILQKIAQIQKQLPELLSKIINLEGKQKPMSFIEQVIQTNKLVATIKLSQIFRQNQKIEDQFSKIQIQQTQKQRKAQGYNHNLQVQKTLIQSKKLQDISTKKSTIKTVLQDFLFYRKVLESGSLRIGKSNVSKITLTKQQEQKLKSKIRFMNYREEIKFKIQQFNREVFLLVKKQDEDTVSKVKKMLRELSGEVQYLFLDNYFDQNVFDDIIITLALKEMSLADYMWKNFQTISYQTKFRLLIQTLNSVVTLWMKNQISFESLSINSFIVTKNLGVKLRKIQYGRYIHPCRLQNEEALLIMNQRKEIMKQFANIYFDILFNKKGASIRSQKLRMKNEQDYRQNDLIFQSLNQMTKYYYPNNLFTLIIGLNYFFIQQYFHNFRKSNVMLKAPQCQTDSFWKVQHQMTQNFQSMIDAKKGGPRVDLVLAMMIQFLEEHENKQPDLGGEI